MEPGPQPVNRQVRDIHVSEQSTFDDFRCSFFSALPVVGSTCSDLAQFPHCNDSPKASYTRRGIFTAWNVHSRSYITSFSAKQSNLKDGSGPSPYVSLECELPDYGKKFLSREDTLLYLENNRSAITAKEYQSVKVGLAFITPNGVVYP